MKWFKNWGKTPPPSNISVVARFEHRIDGDENPVGKAVSGDWDEEEIKRALQIVVLTNGLTLGETINREKIPELTRWIHGQGWDPLPRALVRLLADSARREEKLADQTAICAYWDGGIPPKEVWDGPATLAQIIGIPIKLFYSDREMMVIVFEP